MFPMAVVVASTVDTVLQFTTAEMRCSAACLKSRAKGQIGGFQGRLRSERGVAWLGAYWGASWCGVELVLSLVTSVLPRSKAILCFSVLLCFPCIIVPPSSEEQQVAEGPCGA
ncbi:hypothetical protein NDU88_002149 [Pleurodeles waltl]|uniref:Uncharacterized protein n=1 Tax=Pleurodeles waltl TaxID=8319 RepID=A0AAV7P5Y2_PLEWA|nr:hypothetical protein NDU88_002149 [Pleurodeles waltl]